VRFLIGFLLTGAALAQQPVRTVQPPQLDANLPVQLVGPNDLLAVSVYDAPELSRTVRVSAEGLIRLPMLKQKIQAEGRYPADLEADITAALREEDVLVDPYVTVTIAEYHSRPISVAGAVKMPLVFQAEQPTTLLEAIARAQGLREDAGQQILVTRSETGPGGERVSKTQRVDVRGLIDAANPDLNVTLTGGEEIRVPEVDRIYVLGNIKKPGAFPVQDGAETTVLQMLALAEGLAPYAANQAYVYRRDAAGVKNEILIPLHDIMKRRSADVPLMAHDILYIPDNSGKRLTVSALDRIVSFGSTTASGVLVWQH